MVGVDPDLAGDRGVGGDLRRRAAPQLQLLAHGTVPRMVAWIGGSITAPKSSERVTDDGTVPRSTLPVASAAAIGCGDRRQHAEVDDVADGLRHRPEVVGDRAARR